jgi:hypothetical protein
MRKTVLSLIAAGIVGAAMAPAAHAITPGATTEPAGMTGMQTDQSTIKQQRAQLRHDRMLLRRDVRLGKTSEARRLRREINADERAIRQARSGTQQQGPSARSVQPLPPSSPQQKQNPANTGTGTSTQPQTNK